jgi:hypothetical protein
MIRGRVLPGRGGMIAALVVLVAALAGAGVAAGAGANGFEHPASSDTAQQFVPGANVQRQDTPDDPSYDQAEPDTLHGHTSSNFYDERFDLFGFPSELTPTAVYRDGPHAGLPMVAGFNASGAWKAERGRSDVVIAILDTGVNWGATGLRLQIHLNTGELPYPELADGSSCGRYDCNGDGVVNVADYANDPRVSLSYPGRTGPSGLITAQDLIHAFGDCEISAHLVVGCTAGQHWDNDHNGFANDIAGWNFFDNNNDPTDLSSYFAAHYHGTGRALDAAETGNDKQGSIGVCPHCQILPVRTWDTFVSDGNTFGLGMVYAADNGARVIEGANGSLDHTAFAQAASDYAYAHGVVQIYSGDDLHTADHNYPADYGHAMLIQGTVPDTIGLGTNNSDWLKAEGICGAIGKPVCLGSNLPVGTFFRNAGTTQYGGKSSISMTGATGSVNTSLAAGAAGLVVSAGLDHGIVLRPDETRELLEQTAERVTSADSIGAGIPDPGADPSAPADQQWTTHFGWGRADVGAAVGAVVRHEIPPEAAIGSPDWYAPVTGTAVRIAGLARARFAQGGRFRWRLMWGPGLAPSSGSWHVASQGESDGTVRSFGSIDLATVRRALASYTVPPDAAGPVFAAGEPSPFVDQFTVQLEVSGAGIGLTGIDRRVLTALDDPTLEPGFPKRLGTGGEAPIRYGDLTGDGTQELIVPTEDGLVHAYRPSGRELRGWPVRTETEWPALGHSGSPGLTALGLPREAPRAPVIASLDGSGRPDVITAAGTHVYAWQADGRPVPGFPVSSDFGFCGPAHEQQASGVNPGSHPKCGFLASPAIAHLQGYDKPADIVEPSLDGHLYAWQADGRPVPGYPVALIDPAQVKAGTAMVAESINDPAVGDLLGKGYDDVVVASNELYGAPAAGSDLSFAGLTAAAAGSSGRLYAIDGRSGTIMPGWPVSLPGIIQNELPLIGPGQDASIVKLGGQTEIIASSTGGALEALSPAGSVVRTFSQVGPEAYGAGSDATDRTGALNLFESASIGDLLGTGTPDVIKYEISLSQGANLLLVGQNFPYNHLIAAYDGSTGAALPAYPTVTDDYQLLSASDVAKLQPGAENQLLAGTGLGLLHAYDGITGHDIAGFPKVTGGWLFAPAALSGDGRIADVTREGYLFEWKSSAPGCQTEWPQFRHDPQDTGNYGFDGVAPSAVRSLHAVSLGGGRYRVSFTSGAVCGGVSTYLARAAGRSFTPGRSFTVAGARRSISEIVRLPAGVRRVVVQGRNRSGVLGYPVSVRVRRGSVG